MLQDRSLGNEHGGAGVMFGLLSILLASVIGVIIVAVTISPSSSNKNSGSSPALLPFTGSVPTLPGNSSATPGLGGEPSAAEASACEADEKSVDIAVLAYQAQNGAYPAPASAWSAATYTANYSPLTTSTSRGGPYLQRAISTTHYVVEYDAAGHVWVEPPGQYDAAYNPSHGLDVATGCADVAR